VKGQIIYIKLSESYGKTGFLCIPVLAEFEKKGENPLHMSPTNIDSCFAKLPVLKLSYRGKYRLKVCFIKKNLDDIVSVIYIQRKSTWLIAYSCAGEILGCRGNFPE
jgi:hypothetical protein